MKYMMMFSLVISGVLGVTTLTPVDVSLAKSKEKKSLQTQVITIPQLHQRIMEELRERIESQDLKLSVKVLFPKTPIEVPKGQVVLEIPPDRFGNLTGRRAFRVQVSVDSQLIKTVSVVTSVTARAEVMTPVRWIKFHEVLQANDLVKTSVNLRTLNQDVIMQPDDLIGKQATRSLAPYQPIRPSYVTDPPLVHKGDRVMIEVRRGGLFVQTIGVAKASGQSGELIPVTNQTSGRDILGTVLAAGVVEVRF